MRFPPPQIAHGRGGKRNTFIYRHGAVGKVAEGTRDMTYETEQVEIHRGLKGVYFDRSRVCDIDGRGWCIPSGRVEPDEATNEVTFG
mgnify:CR=1 FL=1